MYPQERPARYCAICRKAACVCGCEKWEYDDGDDDSGPWEPAKLPLWFVVGIWFVFGVACGVLLAIKSASGG